MVTFILGFMPLNKQEIRLDSAEIERKGASAVVWTACVNMSVLI